MQNQIDLNDINEQEVIGAMLIDPYAYYQIAERIRPEFFSRDSHRKIYRACLSLDSEGKPIDCPSVTVELVAQIGWPGLASIGGTEYLMEVCGQWVKGGNIAPAVARLLESANIRQVQDMCTAVAGRAEARESTADELLDNLESRILTIRSQSAQDTVFHASTITDRVYEDLKLAKETGRQLLGLPTGIGTLDDKTTGIRESQLWVLGGRTGEGKSATATQIAIANCMAGNPVLIFSPEMTKEQIIQRMCIQTAGIETWKYRTPSFMGENDLPIILSQLREIEKWPLYIDSSSAMTGSQIVARARQYIRRHGIKLVIVDYVQLVEAKGANIRERVSQVSTHLRQLAKDYVPVLALSQMPRPEQKAALHKFPTKYDLKESGNLENDATVIVMIHRGVDAKTFMPNGNDTFVIPKQRYGPVTHLPVTFDTKRLSYVPREEQHGE